MYAIIGAGPTGLAMARNLDRRGIPFVGFEIHSDVGGLWDIDSPTSTMYESAHLISSKRMTEFKEFPMPERVAEYPSHREVGDYFREYAKHFGLKRHFRFNTRVERVERDGDGWLITSSKDGEEQTERFSGLVIANGTLHHPNMISLPGEFTGELMHSASYRKASQVEGKRVLIIGCGNSGADIAVEAVHHAASVDISLRRGYWFMPKFVAGRPIDTLGGKTKLPRRMKQIVDAALIRSLVGMPSDYGLPDPDYRLYESHPVMNSLILHHLGQGDIKPRKGLKSVDGQTITFEDGSQGTYDLVLLATGYKLHFPFIDRAHLNWPESEGAPQLYLNTFHPEYDNLFILGMVEATGLGWEGRYLQADVVASYIQAKRDGAASAQALRERARKLAAERLDGGFKYLKLERMAYYVHKDTYLSTLQNELNQIQARG